MKKILIIIIIITAFNYIIFAEDIRMKKVDYREITNTVLLYTNGLIIAGESIALLVGMHLLSNGNNPWISAKNVFFAITDIITGSIFLCLAVTNTVFYVNDMNLESTSYYQTGPIISFIIALFSLITHSYREFEFFGQDEGKFLTNSALFAMNNVKLGLLLTGVGFGIVVNVKLLK